MSRPIQIKPFKKKSSSTDQYEKIWDHLSVAITQIYNKNASSLSFEELYRNAYNLVVQRHGEYLYNNVKNLITSHLEVVVSTKLSNLRSKELLYQMKKVWNDHKTSMVMIRDILLYMDRMYVKTAKVTPVYEMGMDLFRDNVLRYREYRIKEKFVSAFLELIQAERSGEKIDTGILKSLTEMLLALGMDNTSLQAINSLRTVYEVDFEDEFLSTSRSFYAQRSLSYLNENNAISYLKKAEEGFNEEYERVKLYLHHQTWNKLKLVLEQELLEYRTGTILNMENSGLRFMLSHDNIDDLRRLHKLFGYLDNGLDLVRQGCAAFIADDGTRINSQYLPNATVDNSNGSNVVVSKSVSANQWTSIMLKLKQKLDRLLHQAFPNDTKSETVFNNSLESVVGKNPKAAEYLSIYLDEYLSKKSRRTDEELEVIIEQAIHLFRYIPDKDVFEKFHKQHLAKRLLQGKSISQEMEKTIIIRLKSECGFQFTSKLEGMFNDIKISSEIMAQYKEHLHVNPSVSKTCSELAVTVLTATYWPLASNEGIDFTSKNESEGIPNALSNAAIKFTKFYLNLHTGRKLYWLLHMSFLDITANFDKQNHEFIASFYQGLVLLCFNDSECLTFEQLRSKLSIKETEIIRALQSFACSKYKVLIKSPKSKDINTEEDSFSLNTNFTHPQYKLKIPTVTLVQQEEQVAKEAHSKIEESRKFMINAAIVRIMKSRKEIEHSLLIAEVCSQLSGRFVPDPVIIKRQIEVLIDREYLERIGVKTYRYIA